MLWLSIAEMMGTNRLAARRLAAGLRGPRNRRRARRAGGSLRSKLLVRRRRVSWIGQCAQRALSWRCARSLPHHRGRGARRLPRVRSRPLARRAPRLLNHRSRGAFPKMRPLALRPYAR